MKKLGKQKSTKNCLENFEKSKKKKKKIFIMRKLGKQKLQKQSKYEKSKGRKKRWKIRGKIREKDRVKIKFTRN